MCKGKLLLVEDNNYVLDLALEALEGQGYEIQSATNAAEALEIVNSGFVPTVLFTDIVMPGEHNGVELANQLVEKHPEMRVLLTTGWTDKALNKETRFPVLSKPYLHNDLIRRLDELN